MHHRSRMATRAAGSALLVAAVLACGCSEPLFSPRDERTQFDRYDRVRNRYAPQYIEDEYGRLTPNLRGRLEPRSQ